MFRDVYACSTVRLTHEVRARAGVGSSAAVLWGLADGLAASPQETRLRLLLHRSSPPRPVAQDTVETRVGSWPAWTSHGPGAGWRWSTTGRGTPNQGSSPLTGAGSTG